MASATKMVLVAAIVLVLLSLFQFPSVLAVYWKVVEVHVINDLGINKTLTLHCNAYDDLGVKSIVYNGQFSWSFRVKTEVIYPTCYCEMAWERSPGVQISGKFIMYLFERDDPLCDKECWRVASANGIFALDTNGKGLTKMYDWPN
ncbi:uncharacterized protein LOC122654933 [Telopea speciosissima]|uniref:uncharacterized protein LOC122654933 n=1 Tax=Telopea speciosissima TaxID=54955 RepID=UPI001CC3BBCC|nr:uncharacterized protein LOC122654933 [Telopea speciosissima]